MQQQQITNMQTNSPPKLDTSKTFYFLPHSKTMSSPPTQK